MKYYKKKLKKISKKFNVPILILEQLVDAYDKDAYAFYRKKVEVLKEYPQLREYFSLFTRYF